MKGIIAAALLTEALWQTIKLLKNVKEINKDVLGAIILGIIVAFAAKIDIFEILGIPMDIRYLGNILTGILISRGSNFIHDLLGNISESYQVRKTRQS
ncbi:MAG TPA: hypothetical protein DEF85_04215 [Clostridiaceae bacterium]|nr:hypothetical protein [Clostridiaceae bacterium]HBF78189.1 hypothetical protein [Clostridiaceae bacterium]HBG37746.1 hypothetical protein [Clostridiaceae bacterium]HBN29298.1 hypothetical protein [Clostridiaceae bacterium]HBX48078.1 hypothetical protein [Clostridiaceae bacterium]